MDYPNVPNLPGVPILPRDPSVSEQTVDYSTSDTSAGGDAAQQKWGLFTVDGGIALKADSVIEVDYLKDYNVPSYPIEDGSFETYNKVEMPYESTLVLAKAGSVAERSEFFQTLESMLASTVLYDIHTPEKYYPRANVIGIKLSRSATRGAGMIVVEVHLREIRIGAAAQYSNTKSDNASNKTDTGAVQGQTPSSATVDASQGENTIGE